MHSWPILPHCSEKAVCPVHYFELYISKINPAFGQLWQKPKKSAHMSDQIWFDKVPVGITKLGNFMKDLSQQAALSAVFTNHSICATCITNLDQACYESRHIMAVSSHKSESMLKTHQQMPWHQEMSNVRNAGNEDHTQKSQTNPPPALPGTSFDPTVMDLVPVDDLSDDILTKFLDDTEKMLATENAKAGEMSIQLVQPVTSIVQNTVNTMNNVPQNFPIPQMYCPNSNIMINYNFKN